MTERVQLRVVKLRGKSACRVSAASFNQSRLFGKAVCYTGGRVAKKGWNLCLALPKTPAPSAHVCAPSQYLFHQLLSALLPSPFSVTCMAAFLPSSCPAFRNRHPFPALTPSRLLPLPGAQEVLDSAEVVCATCSGAGDPELGDRLVTKLAWLVTQLTAARI